MNEQKYDTVFNNVFRKAEPSAVLPRMRPPRPSREYVSAHRPKKPARQPGTGFMFTIGRLVFNMGGTPFWEKHLTTLFYGPRSQGKSLHQAKTVQAILKYLDALYRFYPALPQAMVISNQKFNPVIEEKYLGRRLFYWESIQQLKFCPRTDCWKTEYKYTILNAKWVKAFRGTTRPEGVPIVATKEAVPHRLHDCYIIIDDAATIIPADGWQDLPRWFRKLFAQAGHNGVHCIANIQDPVGCDINFRRYVDLCFKFNKVMGNRRPEPAKPRVGLIWGIYTSREIPAEELWTHGDKSEQEIELERLQREEYESAARAAGKKIISVGVNNWKRRYHFIRRRDTEIYDTLQNVPEYMPNSLEHIEMKCIDPTCNKKHIRHRPI